MKRYLLVLSFFFLKETVGQDKNKITVLDSLSNIYKKNVILYHVSISKGVKTTIIGFYDSLFNTKEIVLFDTLRLQSPTSLTNNPNRIKFYNID